MTTQIYELRTYTVQVGKLADVIRLYRDEGYPAIEAGGFDKKLIGYFTGDIGALNQLIHLWRFDDDADRRNHWAAVFANEPFMAFARQLRPMLVSQENKLMLAAPWGPTIK
ncbi:MAG: NIPSNAP family protein [Chloroflexi bacterium]|nr:NIPSNAP family protein [Chloroflexota bacterium]